MEYMVFIFALAGFVLAIFVSEALRSRKEEKRFIKSLYEDYGKPVSREYSLERFAKMGSYFDRHQTEGQLDDITWSDLGMDELFKRMNYTFSASGEEYLYHTLRTLKQDERELEHLEETVRFLGEHPDMRVRVQLAMRRLGNMGKYSLYDYLDNLDILGERSSAGHIAADLLFLPLIACLWVNFSVAVLGIVILTIYNIFSYFRHKSEIEPYISSFSYVMRLMLACVELEKLDLPVCGEEWRQIRSALRPLQSMKRNSFWVVSPYRGNSSGDILAIVLDYIRMTFHVDLIKFNSMLRVVREHTGDVDTLITVVGYVETAIAIGEFRQSLNLREQKEAANAAMAGGENAKSKNTDPLGDAETCDYGYRGWCIPELIPSLRETPPMEAWLEMREGYHPLLSSPVKNSICAGRNVLLTGSNASGKSTFLKTVAINAILAQTIHTCVADVYRAPLFQVYSSMALQDDIIAGESYFVVEIKALKRILDAAVGERPVLCFVDEVLRGTNTVERIAASTQILRSLSHSGILCFAATHDIELTELLREEFDNYHFEEDVRDGDVVFNYRLREGKTTTRNAIRLLELMGYDHEVIERAKRQAEHFLEAGVWELA